MTVDYFMSRMLVYHPWDSDVEVYVCSRELAISRYTLYSATSSQMCNYYVVLTIHKCCQTRSKVIPIANNIRI